MLTTYVARREACLCPFCSKDMQKAEFKDELSKAEFEISGLCQDCQDRIFAIPDEE